jgi:hypothetical protein
MSKFNTAATRPARGQGPIVTAPAPALVTHEGGAAYARDAKGELFMLAVVNFVGEDTFYESAEDRDARYARLVRQLAVEDPGWTLRFLRWLRAGANMRSASLVGAAEFVHARLAARAPSVAAYDVEGFDTDRGVERVAVDVVCQRADEPGELLAYWMSKYGRAVPMPVKRGLGDAARRLFDEYGLLKYDTAAHAVRFADVIDLTHPTPDAPWQGDLFRFALDRRHGRAGVAPESLFMVRQQQLVRDAVAGGELDVLLDARVLRSAGMTWEDALSLVGSRVGKKELWEALIPTMGIFALARNLRNFDQAGVSDEAAQHVIDRFTDPEQVAKSRMFPFRWLSAYEHAPSLRWGHALDQALQHSLTALPAFPGRTLVLVDTSGSMTGVPFNARSKVSPLKAAAVFGVALAAKGESVDLVGFADGRRPFAHPVGKGASVIREVDRFVHRSGEDGHGTAIAASLRAAFNGHDRVVIVSDMQTMDSGVSTAVPAATPMYGFNLGGYRPTALPSGPGRTELGGLTDATFKAIPLIEAGRRADWPF